MSNSASDKPVRTQDEQAITNERQNQQIDDTDTLLAPFMSAEVDGSLAKRVRKVIADNSSKAGRVLMPLLDQPTP